MSDTPPQTSPSVRIVYLRPEDEHAPPALNPTLPSGEPAPRRRGRPPSIPTEAGFASLEYIRTQWEIYKPWRNWGDVRDDILAMEDHLTNLIDQARWERCTWKRIGEAMGGQSAGSALAWWQRRNAILPKPRAKQK